MKRHFCLMVSSLSTSLGLRQARVFLFGVLGLIFLPIILHSAESAYKAASDFVFVELEWTGDKVILEWEHTSMDSIAYFLVERSQADGKFSVIGGLNPKNLPVELPGFQYEDRLDQESDYVLYRIRQVNHSGQVYYSRTMILDLWLDRGWKISPNPTQDQFFLTVKQGSPEALTMWVYTAEGQVVLRQQVPALRALQPFATDLSTFSAGVYLVELRHGLRRWQQRVIKK